MNKRYILNYYQSLNETLKKGKDINIIFSKYVEDGVSVSISCPFDQYRGLSSYKENFWKPLLKSFSHIEIEPYIAIEGKWCGNNYVCVAANYIGNFENDWLTIPATQKPTWIRFQASYLMKEGKISKAWYFIDVLDVMRQAGYQLFPSRGVEIGAPVPMTGDGIITYHTTKEEGERSITLVDHMLKALCQYDGKNFKSMGDLTKYWNEHNMMWYGPSGIGTTKGLKGFQRDHQFPFLEAFPDRGISEIEDKDFFGYLGEGNYAVHFGFPAMYGTHIGDGWLGLKATGKSFIMRVMDFWRHEDGLLKENWVIIDMIHTLEQLGVDVFELLKQKINKDL